MMRIAEFLNSFKQFFKTYRSHAAISVKPNQQSQQFLKFFVASLVVFLILEPGTAAAASVTELGNLGKAVENVFNAITGSFGKTLATLAVVVLGVMAMFGKLEWPTAIKVIVGIAIVFGAASIIDAISDGTIGTVATGT